MSLGELIGILIDKTPEYSMEKATKVYKDGCILDKEFQYKDGAYSLEGNILSQDLVNTYSSSISISSGIWSVTETGCTCLDFEKNSGKKNYRCKHINSLLIATMIECDKEGNLEIEEMDQGEEPQSIEFFMDSLPSCKKEVIKLNPELDIEKDDFLISLKIGKERLYVVKDVIEFLRVFESQGELPFGKEFTFRGKEQIFEKPYLELMDFLVREWKGQEGKNRGSYSRKSLSKGKQMILPISKLYQVLNIIKSEKVFSKIAQEDFKFREIVEDSLPLKFTVKETEEGICVEDILKPRIIGGNFDVFINEDKFYLPPYEQRNNYKYFRGNVNGALAIDKNLKMDVLEKLVPYLKEITPDVQVEDKVSEGIIIEDLKIDFYIDMNKYINIEPLFRYGKHIVNPLDPQENSRFIKREHEREKEVIDLIKSLGLTKGKRNFTLKAGDPEEFQFLRYGVENLLQYGDIYYSDKLRNKGVVKDFKVKAHIKEKQDYFEFEYSLGEIPKSEIESILNSIKREKRYHKISQGEYIDLEGKELQKLQKFLQAIDGESSEEGMVSISKNKALIIESLIDDIRVDFVEGLSCLEDMRERIHSLKEYNAPLPEELNASLREYQKIGYRWMKSLEYLNFGGILGDEMGLGKTLQAITFLLSNKGKKTLIVAPTSLIYNWRDEFKKFAPKMNVEVLTGTPEEREGKLKNKHETDVFVTSYGTLRRDIHVYEGLNFDYLIIDEAQTIKNSQSLSAKVVKEIKANVRFALTGTPMENSLGELWSIFDFLMPGYLYSEKKFKELFNEEEGSLKKLSLYIKPFILRRKKKDVILELPDKIEKSLIVDMKEEQKRIYKTYVDDVKDKIEEEINTFGISVKLLSYLTRIRQISLDPSLIMDDYTGGSGKLEALLEILEQSIEEGHKILVFSQFTTMLKKISDKLSNINIDHYYLDGSINAKDRMDMVNSFNGDKTPVFLISLKAGGTGLNLTGADVVIHFDPWWNPAVEDQATDRAHRFGQKNIVEVIKLITKDSVEEKIIKLQESKKDLINKVLENGLDSGQVLKSLTEKELLELFN